MLLSIIVPVYNVEKYLGKCLDSLLQQDLSPDNYEIIVINDGSTDNCESIALSYAQKYPNIKLITQKNRGLSGARNTGIEKATGKYIQFVDSDDYLEPNVLSSLISKMEIEQLDLLRYNYQNVNENYEVFAPYKNNKNKSVILANGVTDGLSFLTKNLGYGCYAWQFIVKKDLFCNPQLFFKEGVYFEDTEWTPRIILAANRINDYNAVVYYYLHRTGSITKSTDIAKKRKVLTDLLNVITSIQSTAQAFPSLKVWEKTYTSFICINFLRYLTENLYEERYSFLTLLKKSKVLPIVQIPSISAFQLKIINFSPILFIQLIKLKKIL